MRIVISSDMEAVAQLTDSRQVLACRREYWDSGRHHLTNDVVAAAQGLLDGGASEVIILDNHASGNPWNLLLDELPRGVRAENWNVFDLPRHRVDGMLQVGYHPRAGVAGFVPHTYVPGLELRVDGEPIGESHGRIWAARTPLLGITGHAAHARTLGALSGTPFLVTQEGDDAHRAVPVFADAAQSADAIREFAGAALRGIADAPQAAPPARATFEARLDRVEDEPARWMATAGWRRLDDARFVTELACWSGARAPLAAAMSAAMAPFGACMAGLDLTSPQALAHQDRARLDQLTTMFLASVTPPASALAPALAAAGKPQGDSPMRPVA